jgi:hypothetical protein
MNKQYAISYTCLIHDYIQNIYMFLHLNKSYIIIIFDSILFELNKQSFAIMIM